MDLSQVRRALPGREPGAPERLQPAPAASGSASPAATEPVGGLFRAMHTIKGMAATMGYAGVAELAHRMENLLDAAAPGRGRAERRHARSCCSARSIALGKGDRAARWRDARGRGRGGPGGRAGPGGAGAAGSSAPAGKATRGRRSGRAAAPPARRGPAGRGRAGRGVESGTPGVGRAARGSASQGRTGAARAAARARAGPGGARVGRRRRRSSGRVRRPVRLPARCGRGGGGDRRGARCGRATSSAWPCPSRTPPWGGVREPAPTAAGRSASISAGSTALMKLVGELVIARNRLGAAGCRAARSGAGRHGDRIARLRRAIAGGDHRGPHDAGVAGVRALPAAGARPGARTSASRSRFDVEGEGDRARPLDPRRDRRSAASTCCATRSTTASRRRRSGGARGQGRRRGGSCSPRRASAPASPSASTDDGRGIDRAAHPRQGAARRHRGRARRERSPTTSCCACSRGRDSRTARGGERRLGPRRRRRRGDDAGPRARRHDRDPLRGRAGHDVRAPAAAHAGDRARAAGATSAASATRCRWPTWRRRWSSIRAPVTAAAKAARCWWCASR